MTKKKKLSLIRGGNNIKEWQGGIVSFPGYITGEGEPYRPMASMWMDEQGAIVAVDVLKPDDYRSVAAQGLDKAIRNPAVGPPRRPDRVRVADAEFCATLMAMYPELDIVHGETPQWEEAMDHFKKSMRGESPGPRTYLPKGMDPIVLASFSVEGTNRSGTPASFLRHNGRKETGERLCLRDGDGHGGQLFWADYRHIVGGAF